MHLSKRFRKMTALLLVVVMVLTTGMWNVSAVSAGSPPTGVDLLDPGFISSHGGNFVSVVADPNKSPYAVFGDAFGTDNPVEGATKTARAILGAEVERHVANYYDDVLGKTVFKVEVNGNDCYTCYLHGTTYNSATGKFEGGNDDRQRIEIRPGEESRNLIGLENEITAFNWKLKIDKELTRPDGFFHIFQYKAYNSTGSNIRDSEKFPLHDLANFPSFSSSEDGNPILTFTVSSSATQNLEFRYADIGTDAGQETLAKIPLNDVKDRWLDITVKILNSEYGWVTMVAKDVLTGEVLMEYNDPSRVLDIWRRPEIKYNGQTFEGPYPAVDNMLNRPKWGIYRKADKSNPNVKDAKIYLADMTLYKSAVDVSPVNLAYGKKAYNVGAESGNAYQKANAKPERLTDGVQADPAIYPSMTIPQNNVSALGDLNWVGTESSKKGNVIIDLGKKMDFNQLKLFASERIKNVDVQISEDTADYSEPTDWTTVAFTKVVTDSPGFTYVNANPGANNTVNKQYLIDLGKTYSSRYVKLYFENGGGNNTTDNVNMTYSMSGPPRVSELEIYNAPQTPKNVKVDYTEGSEATIYWDPVAADYFVIYDEGKAFIDQVASNSYHLTNLDPGATYNLSVRNVYTDPYSFKPMLSAESTVVQIKTDGNPIIPKPPSAITVTAASDKSIDITWEALPEAQSYKVAVATDAVERVVADEYKGTSYTVKDLSPGTSYTVKVYSIRRGTPSTAAAEANVTTSGIKNGSDNLLFNKEVRYTRVWNDDASSYGGGKALDNDVNGSRWVALKGSTSAWLMVDIGEITQVSILEYYSYQNKLKKVSFYYATDGEAFTNPDSDKWNKAVTDDRVAQGKYGNPGITSIAESIKLDAPIHARYIKFLVEEVDGDINVNEVKAFGPMSFIGQSALTASEITESEVSLHWAGSQTTLPVAGFDVYSGDAKLTSVSSDVYNYRALGLTPGTDYVFRVRAVSESVYGAVYTTSGGLSLQVKTLQVLDKEPPVWGTSDSLTSGEITTNSAVLLWPAATDNVEVLGYKVFSLTDGTESDLLNAATLTYTLNGLKPNHSYMYQVRAMDTSGNWSVPLEANFKTMRAPLGNTPIDILDPDFIRNHGGNSVSVVADPNKSPYAVFGDAFGTDNPVEGATKTARAILGAEVERHVANYYDDVLGKTVFKVEVNGNDCYTCYLHGTTYNSTTGKFEGGNDDRQRIEIRPGEESRNLIGLENEITAFNWKLKIDKELTRPDGFFHIFQYKAYNSTGSNIRDSEKFPLHDLANFPSFSSSEDGNPILTFTVSSSATQNLEFRYADIGTDAGQETLAKIPLNDVKDRWLDITVKILNSEYGWVTMVAKDVLTGEVLMEYNDPSRVLDIWRRPEIKYNGQTFEGPYPAVDNMLNRPKWGIYRKADKSNPNVKDAKIYLADMTLYKSAVDVSPVNLAYGKKAYNTGAQSGNDFQKANAKTERLTDGVQIDPVKYTNLTAVPKDGNYSHLGDLSWIGTESSKKGNVIIDLGEKMDFNQIKFFTKSLRMKYVNVWVSEETGTYTEAADLDSIVFTPVDPIYTDGGKGWAFFNAANSGGDDAADKEYVIDLGKTYSSRYVKLYFENGSGSNSTGATTFTMTGPPRISELEIYNAPTTPKNVKVEYSGGSEAMISWDNVPADYFVVYDSGKPFIQHVTGNSERLTKLDPGASYHFTVRTAYTDPYSFKPMLSAESVPVKLKTDGDPVIPNPPSSLTAAAASDKSIDVSWEAVADAQSYRVSLVTNAVERVVTDEYKGTSFTIKDLSPGTPYTVKVYSIRRGTPSAQAAEGKTQTTGIKGSSDNNLLFNKEVQYSRVWNDDSSSYGGGKALDNDTADGSRWVALKGSTSAWLMVDIGEVTSVNKLEYYSYQNKLKKVSFYYAVDGEAFTDAHSDKWIWFHTDDRVAQGKYGNAQITKIEEKIALDTPVNARFIKFSVDEVDGDINVNEVKAFGPEGTEDGGGPEPESETTGSGTTGSSPANPSASTGPARLDMDKDAKVTIGTTAEGVSVTKVSVDAEKLDQLLASNPENSVVIHVNSDDPTVTIELPSSALLNAVNQRSQAVIQIETRIAVYELPLQALSSIPMDGILSVSITQVSGKAEEDANEAVRKANVRQVIDHPVEFIIEVDGEEISDLNGVYTSRTISLGAPVDPNKVTAVWIDSNNVMHFVPSVITTRDGVSEITILSPHNSIYTVIQSDKSFGDLKGHWARADVELLANKRIVNGQSEDIYYPEQEVTRAEFAAMLVRSLGLLEQTSSSFADVPADAWFAGAAATAKAHGLIDGFEDGTFRPEERITREQMAVMMVRALRVGGKELSASTITGFTDNAELSTWSREAVSQLSSASLIQGMEDRGFAPRKGATRAEAATMLRRALQYLNFIN
jgi:hypothetical protein